MKTANTLITDIELKCSFTWGEKNHPLNADQGTSHSKNVVRRVITGAGRCSSGPQLWGWAGAGAALRGFSLLPLKTDLESQVRDKSNLCM